MLLASLKTLRNEQCIWADMPLQEKHDPYMFGHESEMDVNVFLKLHVVQLELTP